MESLQDMLVRHEGIKLKPYFDSEKIMMIGVARNLEDMGLTEEEARYLLENDIARIYLEAKRAFSWFGRLCTVRKTVMLNMLFNLGMPRLQGFTMMLKAMERGDYHTAATEMLDSHWAEQVGDRATELAKLMRRGEE